MAEKILHYEVTKGYGKVKEGLRFDVVHKSSQHIDASIAEGLAEAAGISLNEAKTARPNIKYEEI